MRKTQVLGISLPIKLISWVEANRGEISRSRFLSNILLRHTIEKGEDIKT
jgi:hypothetical protein